MGPARCPALRRPALRRPALRRPALRRPALRRPVGAAGCVLALLCGLLLGPSGIRSASASTFEMIPHLGGWGYVHGAAGYAPSLGSGFAVGLRPLPWLAAHAQLDLLSISVVEDPPFTLEEPGGLLLFYGAGAQARVAELGPVEVLTGLRGGLFKQTVTGQDQLSEVQRTTSGFAWGVQLDGWWRLGETLSLGLRLGYLRLSATQRCDAIDGFEVGCEEASSDPAGLISATAGARISL